MLGLVDRVAGRGRPTLDHRATTVATPTRPAGRAAGADCRGLAGSPHGLEYSPHQRLAETRSITGRQSHPSWAAGGRTRRTSSIGRASDDGLEFHPLRAKRQSTPGPVAQLVSAPPCHGGGRGFESRRGRSRALTQTPWSSPDQGVRASWVASRHVRRPGGVRAPWSSRPSTRSPRRSRAQVAQRRRAGRGRAAARASPDLLGLYDGVSLTERARTTPGLPDRITVFRGPLLDDVRDDREELVRGGADHRGARDRPPLRDRRRPAPRARLRLRPGRASASPTASRTRAVGSAPSGLAHELPEEPGLEDDLLGRAGQREQPLAAAERVGEVEQLDEPREPLSRCRRGALTSRSTWDRPVCEGLAAGPRPRAGRGSRAPATAKKAERSEATG